jgi:nodulation protein E
MRRVVVTGIGIISALGLNREEFQANLFAGKSGIREITAVDTSILSFKKAGEVRGFDEKEHFDKRQLLIVDRFTQFSVVTAREAVRDAGIEWNDERRKERTAVVTGTGGGGLMMQDDYFRDFYQLNKNRFPPTIIPRAMHNAPASQISMEFGIYGPNYTVSTACSSSNHAIGQAFHLIRSGAVDAAVTGGSETTLGLSNLKAWDCMRVVSGDTCRPFSKDRSGMVLGEGGATLILETLESARERGAEIYAEIAGFGMSADAHHITQPSSAGASRAMRWALQDAGIAAGEIGYINAHGTATQANDVMESEAIKRTFGEHAENIAVSSTKSMHAHTLGAAGAIEAVATVLALKHGVLPPTANFTEPDPACDIDVIRNEAREKRVEAAVSNSFAFGGLNASLVFKRSEQ